MKPRCKNVSKVQSKQVSVSFKMRERHNMPDEDCDMRCLPCELVDLERTLSLSLTLIYRAGICKEVYLPVTFCNSVFLIFITLISNKNWLAPLLCDITFLMVL